MRYLNWPNLDLMLKSVIMRPFAKPLVNKSIRLIISVYVDDIQIFSPRGSKEIHILKKELHKKFAMTDLELCLYYLSMEIWRDRIKRIARITQSTHLRKVLVRFSMANYAIAPTPMVLSTQLHKEHVDEVNLEVVRMY